MLMGILITLFAAVLTLVFGLINYITVFSVLLPSIMIFFGAGIIFPVATTNALEKLSSIAGTAGSIFGGSQSIGAAICVGIASCFHISNQLPLGIILCILLLFSTILLIVETKVHNKIHC
jgi:DHA1 family 2-module integral membrane pump EmrD-like MFS transporter